MELYTPPAKCIHHRSSADASPLPRSVSFPSFTSSLSLPNALVPVAASRTAQSVLDSPAPQDNFSPLLASYTSALPEPCAMVQLSSPSHLNINRNDKNGSLDADPPTFDQEGEGQRRSSYRQPRSPTSTSEENGNTVVMKGINGQNKKASSLSLHSAKSKGSERLPLNNLSTETIEKVVRRARHRRPPQTTNTPDRAIREAALLQALPSDIPLVSSHFSSTTTRTSNTTSRTNSSSWRLSASVSASFLRAGSSSQARGTVVQRRSPESPPLPASSVLAPTTVSSLFLSTSSGVSGEQPRYASRCSSAEGPTGGGGRRGGERSSQSGGRGVVGPSTLGYPPSGSGESGGAGSHGDRSFIPSPQQSRRSSGGTDSNTSGVHPNPFPHCYKDRHLSGVGMTPSLYGSRRPTVGHREQLCHCHSQPIIGWEERRESLIDMGELSREGSCLPSFHQEPFALRRGSSTGGETAELGGRTSWSANENYHVKPHTFRPSGDGKEKQQPGEEVGFTSTGEDLEEQVAWCGSKKRSSLLISSVCSVTSRHEEVNAKKVVGRDLPTPPPPQQPNPFVNTLLPTPCGSASPSTTKRVLGSYASSSVSSFRVGGASAVGGSGLVVTWLQQACTERIEGVDFRTTAKGVNQLGPHEEQQSKLKKSLVKVCEGGDVDGSKKKRKSRKDYTRKGSMPVKNGRRKNLRRSPPPFGNVSVGSSSSCSTMVKSGANSFYSCSTCSASCLKEPITSFFAARDQDCVSCTPIASVLPKCCSSSDTSEQGKHRPDTPKTDIISYDSSENTIHDTISINETAVFNELNKQEKRKHRQDRMVSLDKRRDSSSSACFSSRTAIEKQCSSYSRSSCMQTETTNALNDSRRMRRPTVQGIDSVKNPSGKPISSPLVHSDASSLSRSTSCCHLCSCRRELVNDGNQPHPSDTGDIADSNDVVSAACVYDLPDAIARSKISHPKECECFGSSPDGCPIHNSFSPNGVTCCDSQTRCSYGNSRCLLWNEGEISSSNSSGTMNRKMREPPVNVKQLDSVLKNIATLKKGEFQEEIVDQVGLTQHTLCSSVHTSSTSGEPLLEKKCSPSRSESTKDQVDVLNSQKTASPLDNNDRTRKWTNGNKVPLPFPPSSTEQQVLLHPEEKVELVGMTSSLFINTSKNSENSEIGKGTREHRVCTCKCHLERHESLRIKKSEDIMANSLGGSPTADSRSSSPGHYHRKHSIPVTHPSNAAKQKNQGVVSTPTTMISSPLDSTKDALKDTVLPQTSPPHQQSMSNASEVCSEIPMPSILLSTNGTIALTLSTVNEHTKKELAHASFNCDNNSSDVPALRAKPEAEGREARIHCHQDDQDNTRLDGAKTEAATQYRACNSHCNRKRQRVTTHNSSITSTLKDNNIKSTRLQGNEDHTHGEEEYKESEDNKRTAGKQVILGSTSGSNVVHEFLPISATSPRQDVFPAPPSPPPVMPFPRSPNIKTVGIASHRTQSSLLFGKSLLNSLNAQQHHSTSALHQSRMSNLNFSILEENVDKMHCDSSILSWLARDDEGFASMQVSSTGYPTASTSTYNTLGGGVHLAQTTDPAGTVSAVVREIPNNSVAALQLNLGNVGIQLQGSDCLLVEKSCDEEHCRSAVHPEVVVEEIKRNDERGAVVGSCSNLSWNPQLEGRHLRPYQHYRQHGSEALCFHRHSEEPFDPENEEDQMRIPIDENSMLNSWCGIHHLSELVASCAQSSRTHRETSLVLRSFMDSDTFGEGNSEGSFSSGTFLTSGRQSTPIPTASTGAATLCRRCRQHESSGQPFHSDQHSSFGSCGSAQHTRGSGVSVEVQETAPAPISVAHVFTNSCGDMNSKVPCGAPNFHAGNGSTSAAVSSFSSRSTQSGERRTENHSAHSAVDSTTEEVLQMSDTNVRNVQNDNNNNNNRSCCTSSFTTSVNRTVASVGPLGESSRGPSFVVLTPSALISVEEENANPLGVPCSATNSISNNCNNSSCNSAYNTSSGSSNTNRNYNSIIQWIDGRGMCQPSGPPVIF